MVLYEVPILELGMANYSCLGSCSWRRVFCLVAPVRRRSGQRGGEVKDMSRVCCEPWPLRYIASAKILFKPNA